MGDDHVDIGQVGIGFDIDCLIRLFDGILRSYFSWLKYEDRIDKKKLKEPVLFLIDFNTPQYHSFLLHMGVLNTTV